jgi:xylulokinase
MIAIGLDIGSSSIKAAVVDLNNGTLLDQCSFPKSEMKINAPQITWAEQDPELWWQLVCKSTQCLKARATYDWSSIASIGIAYQMHGLVMVDKDYKVIRPAIIWCDSRAIESGNKAQQILGQDYCHEHLLNNPGNFTASKLSWVKENEPKNYSQCYKFMLPGDFIAMKLTGEITTTIPGLSEGIFWDFKQHGVADALLDSMELDRELIPELVDSFEVQGVISKKAVQESGIPEGVRVTYRAGDQCNNAFALNVMMPGEIAATGGTSGVIYGVTDEYIFDPEHRVNTFAHVNHTSIHPKLGVLLCINGAGSQYAWIKQHFGASQASYDAMNHLASSVSIGSNDLCVLPFGNGSERMLKNKSIGATFTNIHFNTHKKAHFYRAALEGIAFSFVYGAELLKDLGLDMKVIKVGNDNLFNSTVFTSTLSNILQTSIEVVDVNGAVGAARASGLGLGFYSNHEEANIHLAVIESYQPAKDNSLYLKAYSRWLEQLTKL